MSFLFVRRSVRLIASASMILGVTGAVLAADVAMPAKAPLTPAPAIEAWTFSLTPYVWATSLTGSTAVKGRTTDVDVNFFQILDHTQFPKGLFQLAALGEARYGRFAVLTDVAYMKLGLGASLTKSRGVDLLGVSVGASAGLTVEMVIAEAAAAYEIARWNGLSSPRSTTALDLYAGARAWWQRAEADLAISGTLNFLDLTRTANGTFSAQGNVSWVDPLVGVRLRHQFAPAWNLAVSGDIGGFGAGSKSSWQALAVLEYEFARRNNVSWSGMAGYKALAADYSRGAGLTRYEYNMTMHGPIFGVTARF
jgi:hypothetical protein